MGQLMVEDQRCSNGGSLTETHDDIERPIRADDAAYVFLGLSHPLGRRSLVPAKVRPRIEVGNAWRRRTLFDPINEGKFVRSWQQYADGS